MQYYSGVGSRDTPSPVGVIMYKLAKALGVLGYCLRSGMASGADTYFELGCDKVNGDKQIYLPWKHPDLHPPQYISTLPVRALDILKAIHPDYSDWKPASQKLHIRNIGQVLGPDLQTPSRFLLCWTPGGEWKGGTRTALKVAQLHQVPLFNLGSPQLEGFTAEGILDLLDRQGYLS